MSSSHPLRTRNAQSYSRSIPALSIARHPSRVRHPRALPSEAPSFPLTSRLEGTSPGALFVARLPDGRSSSRASLAASFARLRHPRSMPATQTDTHTREGHRGVFWQRGSTGRPSVHGTASRRPNARHSNAIAALPTRLSPRVLNPIRSEAALSLPTRVWVSSPRLESRGRRTGEGRVPPGRLAAAVFYGRVSRLAGIRPADRTRAGLLDSRAVNREG